MLPEMFVLHAIIKNPAILENEFPVISSLFSEVMNLLIYEGGSEEFDESSWIFFAKSSCRDIISMCLSICWFASLPAILWSSSNPWAMKDAVVQIGI